MSDLRSREFWQQGVSLWKVVVIVLALGTIPGGGAAWVLSEQAESTVVKTVRAQRNANVRACEANNGLRAEVNNRTEDLERLRDGMVTYLSGAAKARLDPKSTSYDPALGAQWERIHGRLADVHFTPVQVPNCERTFPQVQLTELAALASEQ